YNIEFKGLYSNPLTYAHNLFLNNKLVTDLTIPENAKSIGKYVFYGCTSLKSVTIPNSITSIGSYSFYNCTEIATLTISDNVRSIGSNAVSQNTVIYGSPSSVAEIFANSNGNRFIPLPDFVEVFSVKKYNYFVGSKIEPNSVIIAAYFSSGEVRFYYKNFTVSGFDTSTAGQRNVTVSYLGKTDTFSINVSEPTANDLTATIDMILGKEDINEKYDYTGDGNVNILDLIAMKKQVANM
ncbi:MAG: leucine-rich repeat protein, partial [Clostridia bacterium]|nr:leucine-rich repeat protein [Clostridia bacterium]